ncbi:MAG: Wzz/FepE/Etk N-terminal domain-containing protein [Clostridiales bacterium]
MKIGFEKFLPKSKKIFLFFTIISLLIVFIYNYFIISNNYTAESEFYIKSKLDDGITYGDIEASNMIKNDYINILKSEFILKDVQNIIIKKYPKYKNISLKTMKNSIKIFTDDNIRMVKVSVVSKNPKISEETANLLLIVLKTKMDKLSNEEYIDIVKFEDLSKKKYIKNNILNLVEDLILGLGFSLMLGYISDFILIDFRHNQKFHKTIF